MKNLLILLGSVIMISCSGGNKNREMPGKVALTAEHQQALQIMQDKCYLCHNPSSASHDDILAPPFASVKFRYQQQYKEREEFIQKMSEFMLEPEASRSLLPAAVERFNLMLPLAISEKEAKLLAAYLYDHDPQEPAWFDQHFKEEHPGVAR